MRKLLSLLVAIACAIAHAAENLPPAPARYFTDYTKTVREDTAAALNGKLEQFEKETSSQVVVAMFSRLPENTALEDYVNRLFREWKIGQASRDNGILLIVFKDDRRLRVEVGYGLEGALPDATANQIINREIVPHFKAGNFDAGLVAGVDAILLAARGEYRGTERTAANRRSQNPIPFFLFFIIMMFVFGTTMMRFARRGTQYHRRRRTFWGPVWTSGWGGGGWSRGGGWGGGGGGGFSGGFSGGGGSSGGGGASGSW